VNLLSLNHCPYHHVNIFDYEFVLLIVVFQCLLYLNLLAYVLQNLLNHPLLYIIHYYVFYHSIFHFLLIVPKNRFHVNIFDYVYVLQHVVFQDLLYLHLLGYVLQNHLTHPLEYLIHHYPVFFPTLPLLSLNLDPYHHVNIFDYEFVLLIVVYKYLIYLNLLA